MNLDPQQSASFSQFSRQSRQYGKQHLLADTSDIDHAFLKIPFAKGHRALDVATGGGHTAAWLARHGYEVTASDLTAEMLDRARELLGDYARVVEFRQHAAEDFPYPPASFDVVTCRVAAHHFSNRDRFTSEVARVLKPDGWFVLIDGSVPDDESEAAEWLHRVEKLRDPSHEHLDPPQTWLSRLDKVGLQTHLCELSLLKQPDLEMYFETANTSEANRSLIRNLVETAPESAKRVFQIAVENGKTVWWWTRLTLCAQTGNFPQAGL